MRITMGLATAALAVAMPASAADSWVRDAAGQSCALPALGLKLTPFKRGNTMNFDAYARQGLFASEGDIGMQLNYDEKGKSAGLGSAFLILPNEGVYTDGTNAVRISLDGKLVPERKSEPASQYGAVRLVQWSAADDARWLGGLRQAATMKVDFLDDGGKILRSRTIDVTPVAKAVSALQASRWAC